MTSACHLYYPTYPLRGERTGVRPYRPRASARCARTPAGDQRSPAARPRPPRRRALALAELTRNNAARPSTPVRGGQLEMTGRKTQLLLRVHAWAVYAF